MTITVEKYNESHIRVFAERDIQVEIKEFFTFKAPGYRWSPKFKAKLWDGNISLYNMQTNKLPTGLFELLKVFASKIDEELVVKENPKYASIYDDDTIEYDDVLEFATSLNLSDSKGNPITAKDYQIEAVYESLKKKRIALSMPTGSGKSLTIYIIIRWLLAKDKRTCLLVPNIGLVKQMISDFMEYSLLNGFDIDEATTLLYSGQERNFNPPVLISTWQTMSKMIKLSYGAEALNSYDCIVADECFDPLTKVLMDDGSWKSISKIKPGQKIKNIDQDGNIKTDTVIKQHKNIRDVNSTKMYELKFEDGRKIQVTGNHKLMVSGNIWKTVDEIEPGDDIMDLCIDVGTKKTKKHRPYQDIKDSINSILEKKNCTYRIESLTKKELTLTNGMSLFGKKRSLFLSFEGNGHELYTWWLDATDDEILAYKKAKKKEDGKIGGYRCQELHGDTIRKNLNCPEREPWNKGKKCASTWNKGLSKETNETVKRVAESKLGDKNPMYGKRVSKETREKLSKKTSDRILSGRFTPNSNNRNTNWESSVDGVSYRSSWECAFAYKNKGLLYEKLRIKYFDGDANKIRTYITDFFDGENMVYEVCPKSKIHDKRYKEIGTIEAGYTFKIICEDDIKEIVSGFDDSDWEHFEPNTAKKLKGFLR